MPDTNAAVEESRRRALEAMAQYGQAGVDALKAGQMQVAATQQQAVDTALAGQIARGAPAGVADDLTAIISQPGDIAQQTLAGAAARAQQDQAAISGATASYFDQVNAAMPVMQAAIDKELVAANFAAQEQQAAREFAAQQRQWAVEDRARQMEQEAAAAAAESSRYGGYKTAGEYENAATAIGMDLQQQAMTDAQATEQHAARRATVARHNPDSFAPPPLQPVPSTGRVAQASGTGGVDAVLARVAPTGPQNVGIAPAERPAQTYTPGPVSPYTALNNRTHQAALAGEAARVVGDPNNLYDFQREAAINILGADPADAYGRFLPPEPDDLAAQQDDAYKSQIEAQEQALTAEFVDQFGVAPTGREQLQRFALGEDPFRRKAEPVPAEEAAKQVGVNPREVGELVNSRAFSAAAAAYEAGKDTGMTVAEIDRQLAASLIDALGHDAPKVRALVAAMYAPLYDY